MSDNIRKYSDEKIYFLSHFLNNKFGGRVKKVSLDAGLSCPNRNRDRRGGCFWCDPMGSGSGNDPKLWQRKLREETKRLIEKGFKGSIAYFQSFTNTYGDYETLKKFYTEAIKIEGVVGIAIGTRPDCLDNTILDLLSDLNENIFLWIEIGMQTKHDKTLSLCNRGHSHSQTVEAIKKLKEKGIKTVIHLIAGLPEETKVMILESFEECAKLKPWGVKLHPLHIVKGSIFEEWFSQGQIKLLEIEDYADLAATFIEMISPETVVHRITGERSEDILLAPKWCLDKNRVRNEIIRVISARNSFQGKLFKDNG